VLQLEGTMVDVGAVGAVFLRGDFCSAQPIYAGIIASIFIHAIVTGNVGGAPGGISR